jgi:hypothetical protein
VPRTGVGARVPTGTLGLSLAAGDPPRPTEESLVKKGRHRRFEEARSLKRSVATAPEPCAECGADPEDEHASWCMADTLSADDVAREPEDDPLAE